jgi:hypothetical protein
MYALPGSEALEVVADVVDADPVAMNTSLAVIFHNRALGQLAVSWTLLDVLDTDNEFEPQMEIPTV